MSVASLVVAARTTGAAQITRLGGQLRTLGSNIAQVSRNLTQQTRAVSSVTGAYQDANGTWRNANGTLLMQRHTVTQVTTAFGRLTNGLQRTGRAALRAAASIGGPLRRALSAARRAAADLLGALPGMLSSLGMMASKFVAIGGLVVAALPSIINLAGALQLIAPAAIAAGAALVAVKMATKGVGDALSAGLSGDAEEFKKALKGLAPNARAFVVATVKLAGAWRKLQQTVQNRFFAGFDKDIVRLDKAIRPIAEKWLPRVADAFAAARKSLVDFFARPETAIQLDTILRETQRFLVGMLGTLRPLAQVFLDIAQVAAPSLGDIGEGAQKAAEKFAAWIREMKNSGKLTQWLDKAKETIEQLGKIAQQVGRIITAIFKGAESESGTFLDNLEKSLRKVADWLHSESGQKFIATLGKIGAAIANVVEWIEKAIRKWNEFTEWFSKAGHTIQGALGTISGAIATVAGAFGTILSAGRNAFSWVGGAISAIGGLASAAWRVVGSINAALSGIRNFIPITIGYQQQGYARAINPGGSTGGGGGGKASFRAAGGPVRKGMPYVVGEKRRELFVPDSNGTIMPRVPTGANGGGRHFTINVNVPAVANPAAVGAAVVEAIKVYERNAGTRWRAA